MREEENISVFFSKIQDLVNALHSHGEEMGDTRIMEKALQSLPIRFDPITTTIEEAKYLSQFMIVEL